MNRKKINDYPFEKWTDDLLRCPTQCYYRTEREGVRYILYLRWRWSDPFQAHILKGESEYFDCAEWSNDIFDSNDLWFIEEEIGKAKKKLIELFDEMDDFYP